MAKRVMKTYDLYWAPEGRKIATVVASTARAAKRKAPAPYRRFLGEIYTVEVGTANAGRAKSLAKSLAKSSGWIPAKAFRLLNSGAVQVKVAKGRVERRGRGNPHLRYTLTKVYEGSRAKDVERYLIYIGITVRRRGNVVSVATDELREGAKYARIALDDIKRSGHIAVPGYYD